MRGGSGADTLRGLDASNVWTVSGLNAGSVGGTGFDDIEHLEGGSVDDTFTVQVGGVLTGTLRGGLGLDELIAADGINTWTVDAGDSGTLNALPFYDIESLVGGSNEDEFLFALAGFISGHFTGGPGLDRVRGANQQNTWRLKGSNSGKLNDRDFSSIENIEGGSDADDFIVEDGATLPVELDGGAGSDNLFGPAVDSVWTVDGANAGHVAGVTFNGIENLTGAADNEDEFVFHGTGSISGLTDGGSGGFDTLVLADGVFDTVTFTSLSSEVGTIERDGDLITFAGLEPVIDGTPGSKVVTAPDTTSGPDVITISGTGTQITVASPSFAEDFVFTNPGDVTVNALGGDDIIIIQNLGAFAGTLDINAGAGNDIINFQSVTSTASYDIDGGSDTTGDKVIASVSGSGDITLSDTELNVSGEMIAMAGIELADLTGGDGANIFTVTDWTGTGTLDGAGNSDTVVATNDVNFTLGDTSLARSGLGTLTLNQIEVANLTGKVGENKFSVSDWSGNATLSGAGGSDVYEFDDNWGTVEVVEDAAGGLNDKLDFGPYSDTGSNRDSITITPQMSGDVVIAGSGNTVTLNLTTKLNIEDLENANINLTGLAGSVEDELVGGLNALVDFARNIASVAEFATTLPLVGGNADVAIAKALDFAEALDELRLEVESLFGSITTVTTDALIARLNSVFNAAGLPDADKVLDHLGAAALSPQKILDSAIDALDTYSFNINIDSTVYTIIVDVDTTSPGVSGNTVTVGIDPSKLTLAGLGEAIQSGIAQLGLSTEIGAKVRDGRLAIQAFGTGIQNFSVEGLADSITKLGYEAAAPIVISNVQDVLQNLGNLEIGLAQGVTLAVDFDAGKPQLRLDVDYEAQRSSDFFYNLGLDAQSFGLAFDIQAKLNAMANLVFDFQLGLELGATTPTFFLDVDQLSAGFNLDATVSNVGVNVGFLSLAANGMAELDAGIAANFADSSGLTIAQLQADPTALLQGSPVTVTGSNGMGMASLNISLTIGVDASLNDLGGLMGTATLTVINADPLDGSGISLSSLETDFETLGFDAFNNLNAAGVVSLLGQLRGWFNNLADSELIGSIEIPFVQGGLNKILDLAEVVGDALLFDDGADNEKDGGDKLVTDLNSALDAAGLGGLITAQGDGKSIKFIAVDPNISSFSITSTAEDEGGFSDLLALGDSLSAVASATGLLQLAGSAGPLLGRLTGNAGIRFNYFRNGVAESKDVLLDAALTSTNVGVGDDIAKLVDAANSSSFASAQQLSDRLLKLALGGGAGEVGFDVGNKLLTYKISLTDVPIFNTELATDFEIDLGDLGGVDSDTRLVIEADGSLNLTLGFDLSDAPAGSSKLTDATTLDSLGVDVKLEETIRANSPPVSVTGKLGGDASFLIEITGGSLAGIYEITVTKTDASNNTITDNLAGDFDLALGSATRVSDSATVDISGAIDADHDNDVLKFVATDAAITAFKITTTTGDPAFSELGIQTSSEAAEDDSGDLVIKAAKSVPKLVGQLTADAQFSLQIPDLSIDVLVTVDKGSTNDVDSPQFDNRNLLDLISDVQKAIDAALEGTLAEGKIEVGSESGVLLFTRVDSQVLGSGDQFSIVPVSNAGELGITSPLMSDEADLEIRLSDGTMKRVALDGAINILDVKNLINAKTDFKVTVDISVDNPDTPVDEAGTSLTLTEISPATPISSDFMVTKTNGSLAAIQLGLVGVDVNPREIEADPTAPEAQPDGVIRGGAIGGATLLDRFFITADDLSSIVSADISVSAGRLVEDIAVVSADAQTIFSSSFEFSLDHVGKELNFTSAAGFNAGIFTITSVDEVNNFATLNAAVGVLRPGLDPMTDELQFGGIATLNTGVQATANFGLIGLELTGTANLGVELSLGFDPNSAPLVGDPADDKRLTLQEIINGLSDPLALLLPPDIKTQLNDATPDPNDRLPDFGGLELDVAISAGSTDFTALAGGLLGGTPSISLRIDSLGDPFLDTRFDRAGYALGGSTNQFEVTGNFLDKLPDGITLRFTDNSGSDPVSSIVAVTGTSFDLGLNKTTVTIEVVSTEGSGTFSLPPSLDDFDVLLLPKVDVNGLDGIGDLSNFGEIDFADIIAGLRALSDFLGQFEEFEFLSQKIPLINQSINDLLSFAEDFASAVDAAENNPSGTLQVLETKINEAIGIATSELTDIFNTLRVGTDPVLGLTDAPDDVLDLSLLDAVENVHGNILRFDLALGAGFSEGLDVAIPGIDFLDQLNIPGLDSVLDLSGSAGLFAEGSILLRLQLGIDISSPGNIYLFNETGIAATLNVGGDDLAFRVGLGPFALAIASTEDQNSFIELGATASAGIKDSVFGTSDRVLLSTVLGDLGNSLEASLDGEASGILPVFFPTDSNLIGEIKIGESAGAGFGDLDKVLLSENSSFVVRSQDNPVPDANSFVVDVREVVAGVSAFDPANLSLFDNIFLAIDGLDLALGFIGDLLSGQVGGFTLPLIGDELASSASFIDDLREDLIAPLREGIETAANTAQDFAEADKNIISKLLFDILGPDGIDLLKPLASATEMDSAGDFIDLDASTLVDFLFGSGGTSIEQTEIIWDLTIGSTLVDAGADIGFDLGIPGLGLETEGEINLDIEWELNLGFGLSFLDGFFLKIDGEELLFDISVTLDEGPPPASITGTLGFLELRAEDKELDFDPGAGEDLSRTQLGATFFVDISEKGATGLDADRLAFTEFGSIEFDAGVAAEATAALGLELGLSDELFSEIFGPGASNVIAGFPKIASDFLFSWKLGERGDGATLRERADNSMFQSFFDPGFTSGITDGLQVVGFQDVELDLGSFISEVLGPIVNEVSRFTDPIQPLIDFITGPVPILGDLGISITWLDLAEALAGDKFDVGLIRAVSDLISLINDVAEISASGANVMLPIGDFFIFDRDGVFTSSVFMPDLGSGSFNPSGLLDSATAAGGLNSLIDGAGGVLNALNDLGSSSGSSSQKTISTLSGVVGGDSAGGFAFPFLQDPSQIFGLLTGQPADLVTYDLPGLFFEFEYSQFFPIYGPLGISIGLVVEFLADTAFGYDTLGIQQFVDSGFRNPGLLLNGLFISDSPKLDGVDDPELVFGAELFAAAELNLGIASAGVGARLGFQILFDLFDPNRDGKVRISELLGNIENQLISDEPFLAPLAIFDISGEIFAELFAFLKINFGFFSFKADFPIFGPVTLLSFDVDFFRPPILASEDDNSGNLIVHAGTFSEQRLLGNAKDVSEHLEIVRTGASGDFVNVEIRGIAGSGDSLGADSTTFLKYKVKKGSTIVIDGGEGDDKFVVTGFTASDNVAFDIDGGAGDDIIMLGGTAGVTNRVSVIRGGTGNDTITGTEGHDQIFGGSGGDTINAGGGDDLVFGDEGEIGDDFVDAPVRPTDGNDTIDGAAGSDILIGGGGKDNIHGGITDEIDLLIGGGAKLFFVDGNVFKKLSNLRTPEINQQNRAATQAFDDVQSALFDQTAGDTLAGGLGADILIGTAGPDTLIGSDKNDIIFGLGGADIIDGLGGDDIIFGDDGQLVEVSDGGTSDGASSSTTILHDTTATFLTDGVRIGDFVRNSTLNTFVRVTRVISENELETVELPGGASWSGADYSSVFKPVTISGGEGDEIQGGAGNDLIFGGAGGDIIQGGDDNDEILAGSGADIVFGDNGTYNRTTRVATVLSLGNDGLDRIFGQGEPDLIYGGGDIDIIDGGIGKDTIFGGDGSDSITVNKGNDFVDGQEGSDTTLISMQGGNAQSLVTLNDTGAMGTDLFVVNGTINADQFLLRPTLTGAFVAMINTVVAVERVDYIGMERIVINGSFGDDHFAVDDTRAEVTINGEIGDDTFQIGQIFRSDRLGPGTPGIDGDLNDVNNISDEDAFLTIQVTRGWLSNGISAPMTINGGLGEDQFVVFHNLAVLQLNGGEDDDTFEVRAFALVGSEEPLRERTDISGGAGADLVQYAVNAPVNIDGGDGLDTLIVIGTEFGDDFVVTDEGVFGAGLTINFVNIESLRVDGAEGDDRFFIKSTGENFITELFGGLGSDTFNMSGDTPPVVSNDLKGHSGLILHDVESSDELFDEQALFGISANVADNEEPFAVIRQTDGSTIVTESETPGLGLDTYEIVLTRQPDKNVLIRALAPIPSPDSRERRAQFFRLASNEAGATVTDDGTALTLIFTPDNWFVAQTVQVLADSVGLQDNSGIFTRPELGDNDGVVPVPFDMDDDAFEGIHFGVINHLVQAASEQITGTLTAVDNGSFVGGIPATVTISTASAIAPEEFLGRKLSITEGPGLGQVRSIVGVTETAPGQFELALDKQFSVSDVPDTTSKYLVNIDDSIVGVMTGFTEDDPATLDVVEARTFTDSSANFPTIDEGLRGATLEIIAGPGAGQQLLILGNTETTLTVNGDWATKPVPGESVYRIERYDGLAIPSVSVQINDNDQPGLIIDETAGFNGGIVTDFDTITSLIEGGDGDELGERDIIKVRLSADPGATPVRVALNYDSVQMNLNSFSGAVSDIDGQLVIEFDSSNWDDFKDIEVIANSDTLREGFHTSLIEFVVQTGSGDSIGIEMDEFEPIIEEDAVFFVGLTHNPIPESVAVFIDNILVESSGYQIISNKVFFVDESDAPRKVFGEIKVTYNFDKSGFLSAFTAPVLARISDADAPTVLVRETGGSTDVIEVATAIELITNGDFETGDLSGWTVVATGSGSNWVINNGTLVPPGPGGALAPISGNFDAVSVQSGPATQILTEQFVVPANITEAVLSWQDRIRNFAAEYSDPTQEFRVEIVDSTGVLIQEIFSTSPGDPLIQVGPNDRSFDLTSLLQSLEGQTVAVSFESQELFSFMNATLDNVSLLVNIEPPETELINGNFETGNFDSWDTTGTTSIQTASFGSGPTEGTFQALLSTGGATTSGANLESFLGLAAGSLDGLGNGNATSGSAIRHTVEVSAGEQISFDWNFLTNEGTPGVNDFAFVSIAGTASELADTNSVFMLSPADFNEETGFHTFTHTFGTAGTFTIGVGVTDVSDTVVDSGLLVDDFNIENSSEDTYELVLTAQPTDEVSVTVTPDITKTTRTGGIRHDEVQVAISSSDSRVTDNGDGTLTVKFNALNWDIPVEIVVAAVDDNFVDGGDTKEFAPGPNTLSGILGPVFIEGAGGEGSLNIGAPVMLPGELNIKPKTGDVAGDGVNGTDVTVSNTDLMTVLTDPVFDVTDLEDKTIEITAVDDPDNRSHSAIGQFRLITKAVDNGDGTTTLTVNEAYALNLDGNTGETDDDIKSYAITSESLNFFVDETEQIDFMFVFDQDSPADSSGTLTGSRLSGFNMGPDLVIGGREVPGGINFGDLEVVEINLGTGNNNLTVLGTPTREDGYQTWTFINTGNDIRNPVDGVKGDTVVVKLNESDVLTATGIVQDSAIPGDAPLQFQTNATIQGSFADGELAGQIINIVEDGDMSEAEGQTRRIIDNIGTQLILDRAWEFDPTGETYEIVNPADGSLALNTEGGDDIVDASASTLDLVIFGGDGADNIMGGTGNDIIFGDQGRVDYYGEEDVNGNRAIITRLGSSFDEITGSVTTQVTLATLQTMIDSAASFPVAGADDTGLIGLLVDINNGIGFRQPPLLISGNTGQELTLSEGFDPDFDLPGPDVTNPSEYRISGKPSNPTDGVVRDPGLVLSINTDVGAGDIIDGGTGSDTIIGGAGEDDLTGGAGNDIVFGDHGRLDFSPVEGPGLPGIGDAVPTILREAQTFTDPADARDEITAANGLDIVFGGGGGDLIDVRGTDSVGDIILGDYGRASFNESEILISIESTNTGFGGNDEIIGGVGSNTIIGGFGNDDILAGGDASPDTILGDSGLVLFYDSGKAKEVRTTAPDFGGNDDITAGDGPNILVGGSGNDTINGGFARDIVLGDNGEAFFEESGILTLTEIRTTDGDFHLDFGGNDTIETGDGSDVVLGGSANDRILAGGSDTLRDIVLGDNGEALFAAGGVLIEIRSRAVATGGRDEITVGNGEDVVLGGSDNDVLLAATAGDETDLNAALALIATGDYELIDPGNADADVILGDNGEAFFTNAAVLKEVITIEPGFGGADIIIGGNGPDVILGGADNDTIIAGGDDAAGDVVLGDDGRAVFTETGPLTSVLTLIETIAPEFGGDDFITTGDGFDVVIGGSRADTIIAGGDDAARDVVLGDSGRAIFTTARVLTFIETTAPEFGGDDDITAGNGPDVVLGGTGNDTILAATAGGEDDLNAVLALIASGNFAAIDPGDGAIDVILGDNGFANFTDTAVLLDIQTSDPDQGGNDIIVGGNGPDVIFGGSDNDIIVAGGDDDAEDIVFGDNGRATFQGPKPSIPVSRHLLAEQRPIPAKNSPS